jgi:GT2 family glycosyltransferase
VLEKVGLFDARYFAYMEDVDLCLRAKRGLRLVGEAAAYHATSSDGAATTAAEVRWA